MLTYHNPADPNSSVSRTERLIGAYGVLMAWVLNHKQHPQASRATAQCDLIAERVDTFAGGDGYGKKDRGY